MPYIEDPNRPGIAMYVSASDPRLATSTIQGQADSYVPTQETTGLDTLEELILSFQDSLSGFGEALSGFGQQPERTEQDIRGEVEALYAYLPADILNLIIDGYVDHGDPNRALAEARNSEIYETYFPGNRRQDGSLRYTEQGYASYVERAQIAFASINVNPDLFGERIVEALSAGVQIGELEQRIDTVYERIIDATPEIRARYAALGYEDAANLSDSAILAGALDPAIGRQILDGQITNAEISGEAALRGFGVDLDLATQLRQRGVNRQGASELFSQAAEQLPILDVLQRRHDDPEDEFDLNDFLQASIFDDPSERRRIRRLVAQERSSFSSAAAFSSNRLGLSGLTQR